LPKENEPKEKAPVPLGPSGCPSLLEAAGILQTRFAQTVQNPFSAASAVLSKCQWEIIEYELPRGYQSGFVEPGLCLRN